MDRKSGICAFLSSVIPTKIIIINVNVVVVVVVVVRISHFSAFGWEIFTYPGMQ